MKILVVHSYYRDGSLSGENTVVDAQVEALHRAGHEVFQFGADSSSLAGLSRNASRAATVASGWGGHIRNAISAYRPEIVHLHNLFPNLGSNWLADASVATVATLHNFRLLCAAGTFYRDDEQCTKCPTTSSFKAVVKRCYRESTIASMPLAFSTRGAGRYSNVLKYADRLIFLSRRSAELYVENASTLPPYEIIPNFAPSFLSTPVQRAPKQPETWLYAGRLTQEKGVARLLETWPSDRFLAVAGDGLLANSVQSHARSRLIYLGLLKQAQLAAEIATSVGVLIPSRWSEGLPTIYLQAIASGRPIIAAKGSSAADCVEEEGTGVVVPRDFTESDWSQATAHVRDNWLTLSRRCTDIFRSKYGDVMWLARIEGAYRTAMTDFATTAGVKR